MYTYEFNLSAIRVFSMNNRHCGLFWSAQKINFCIVLSSNLRQMGESWHITSNIFVNMAHNQIAGVNFSKRLPQVLWFSFTVINWS